MRRLSITSMILLSFGLWLDLSFTRKYKDLVLDMSNKERGVEGWGSPAVIMEAYGMTRAFVRTVLVWASRSKHH